MFKPFSSGVLENRKIIYRTKLKLTTIRKRQKIIDNDDSLSTIKI